MSPARTEAACHKASVEAWQAHRLRSYEAWQARREAEQVAVAQAEAAMQRHLDEIYAARAAGLSPVLFDHRKGTIRGFAALVLIVLLIPIVGAVL